MDAHGFKMVAIDGDPRDLLTVDRPGEMHQMEWYAGGLFEYAKRPLVQVQVPQDGSATTTAVALDNLIALNVGGGVAVHDRVRLDLGVPLYFASTGVGDVSQGVGLGDIRLGAMLVALVPKDMDGFGLGVVPYLDVPSGSPSSLLGKTGVAGGFKVAATYELEQATFVADLGPAFNPSIELENLNGSDSFTMGLGGGYLVNPESSINLETHFSAPFSKYGRAGTGFPMEAIVSYRQRHESGGFFHGGLAAGVTQGAGAAAFRLFVGGGFGVIETGPSDRDLDGIVDKEDECPDEPETFNDFEDLDGCPDSLSTLAITVWHKNQAISGADVDIAGADGSTSEKSASEPIEKEVLPDSTWEIKATKGTCLAGDSKAVAKEGRTDVSVTLEMLLQAQAHVIVVDQDDNPVQGAAISWNSADSDCVPVKPIRTSAAGKTDQDMGIGTHTLTVLADGYKLHKEDVKLAKGDDKTIKVKLAPSKVKVTLEKIEILDKVHFETNKAIIKPESYGLLDEVAGILIEYSQIKKVEVSGHTDSQGPDDYNMGLSQRRAEAVRDYLIKKAVKASTLTAKGYGETVSVASNNTRAGRAENRRVEFLILEQETEIIKEQ
jgi:outer membrane protein OmpA-like peptidoglycan-associated protein